MKTGSNNMKIIFVITFAFQCLYSRSETVITPMGKIEGLTTTLSSGLEVEEFLGIPYAESPTGTNRFAPPKPPKPWNRTYHAFEKSPSCFQAVSNDDKLHNWFMAITAESEDCLYLNLWRPAVRKERHLPVMVWIHGGVLLAGSASMPLYDGAILASTQNVIVVSFNYRLSLFGELFLDMLESPGNQALQDQIRALHWVQEYIETFEGDPKKVTLFGHSSGGQSIGFHLTNKNTEGLYRNVILQSGTPNSQSISSTKNDVLNMSLNFAKTVGCPFNSEINRKEILTCLQSKNATELIAPYRKFPSFFKFPFTLVQNGAEVPLNAGSSDKNVAPVVVVPILLGTTTEESGESIKFFFPGKEYDENTTVSDAEWFNLIQELLGLKDQRLINQCAYPYQLFNSSYNPLQVRKEVVGFLSDSGLTCPIIAYADMYSERGRTYMYSYSHPLATRVWGLPSWSGTVHGAEIPFLFGAPVDPQNNFTKQEAKLAVEVMEYWVQFAKTNDPNDENSSKIFWPAFDSRERKYLELGTSSKVRNGLRDKECAFWKKFVPELISLQGDINKLSKT